jgi:hypothetical protein
MAVWLTTKANEEKGKSNEADWVCAQACYGKRNEIDSIEADWV